MRVSNSRRTQAFRWLSVSLLCVWALLALVPAAFASTDTGLEGRPEEAQRALAEGRYAEAQSRYETLLREGGYSAPLLYDLGNAYMRDGKPAAALLSYERARLLAPRDEAIASNLAAARAALGVPIDRGALDRFARSLSMNEWAYLAAVGFWVAVATGGSVLLTKRRRGPLLAGSALAALGAAVAGTALLVSSADLHRGVVMASTPVLVSPFDAAQSEFALVPGEEVDIRRSREGYLFVRDAHGRSGWVEPSRVAPLIPATS